MGETEEVVVVTPLGSFLSSKTAADTAARLAPQLGNSVSCTGAEREEPSWCFFHCLLSPFLDMLSPGTALIACDSDFPCRRWSKAMVICLFVFPERDPSLFFPIVNLNVNVCVEAVVGQMKPHHVFHVKGGPQAVPSTTLHPPIIHPLGPARTSLFFQNRLTKKEVG